MSQLNNVRISLKIDDLSNWISSKNILNNGEVALVRNSDGNIKVKVGDGVSYVSALNYLNETEFFTKKLSGYNANFGINNVSQQYSVAEGHIVSALGAFSRAQGFNAEVNSTDNFAFVWNGQNLYGYNNRYKSHGPGTFSLNPADGLSGIYIGEETLAQILNDKIYIDGVQTPSLSINRVSQDEYHELVVSEQIDENSIYIVSSDMLNMYGERIENVGDAIEDTDAVNKQYVDAITTDLSDEIKSNYVSSVVFNNEVLKLADIDSYLSNAISSKINVDGINVESLSILKIDVDSYHELVVSENVDPNTLYIISSETTNVYGQRIENVGDAIEDTDAVNKQYVDRISVELDQKINAIEIPTKVSDLENDLNYALSSDISAEFKNIENTIEDITNDVEKLSNDLSSKIKLNDNVLSTLNIYKVTTDEYHELVASESVDESAIYIVSSDSLNMYGEKIVNIADPTENNDVTNKEYVDTSIINLSNTISLNYISTITFNDTILKVNDIFAYLSNEISSKIKLDNIDLSTLNIYKVTADEYHELVATEQIDESAIYIVSSDTLNTYEERIENVGDPLSASDAVNKQYVDTITTDLSNEIKSNYVFSNTFDEIISELNHNNTYLSNEISSKIKLDNIDLSTLNICKVTADEYHELVTSESVDESALYIVSSDTLNMYGERIENVGDAIEITDATNKNYVDSTINEVSTNIESEISELSETLTLNIDVVNSTITTLSDTVKSNYVSVVTFNSTISELNIVDTNLSNTISSKIKIDNTDLSTLNIYKVTADEYHNLIVNEQINQSALYIVSSDSLNMYGEKIVNLADPTENNDATNKEYVDSNITNLSNDIKSNYVSSTIFNNTVSELNDINIYLSNSISSKIKVNDLDISSLNIYKVTTDEYHELVTSESVDESALYIVSSDSLDMYGEQIKNLAPATELSDAVNLEQLQIVDEKTKGYKLIKAELVGTTSDVSCFIENRSITTIDLNDESLSVTFVLPETQYAGYARDFILRLNITAMPFIIWDKIEDESWHIDSESGDWTELELGQNIISFIEMG